MKYKASCFPFRGHMKVQTVLKHTFSIFEQCNGLRSVESNDIPLIGKCARLKELYSF